MATPKTLTLPALPIRDMVLFPGTRVPFVVGRSASVRTLQLAIKAGDHLLMLTQKDAKMENPGQADLYDVGTLALVESVIALPKDYYKVGVKGVGRVTLLRYDDTGEVIQAEAYLLPEPSPQPGVSLQP
ncbi:MAG TPA: LON peptidase substrate-binding domain-containing protein, partial [Geothrix sp.]